MSFDNSRYTFNPWKNFSGVVMEQGRVQLDADWNEWLAELSRRIQAGTLDIFGHAAYPPTTPWAFLITATTGSPNRLTIGLGRMYVDGLLAENHGALKAALWDTALAELSGTPQPPDLTNPNPHPLDFTKQPYLPSAVLPTDNGSYLFYLDVWTREVTYLEDSDLVDIAVGVDTTGRLQTVWQVKFMANTGDWTCATPDSEIPYPPYSTGRLTTDVVPNPEAGPCCLTDGSGFTGLENQFYRVEIHQGGPGNDKPDSKTATFKWSRENGSVETSVVAITSVLNSVNQTASQLAVTSLGRDQVLGFKNGDWVEVVDDWSELWGNPGVLAQIDSVTISPPSITLTIVVDTSVSQPATGTPPTFPVDAEFKTNPKRHTRLRRWDQSGIVHDVDGNTWCDLSQTGGAIPVPGPGTTLVLENGITVQFGDAGAVFNVADFWNFAARTADGSVEKLHDAPPRGIHHHYTKLSVVTFSSPTASNPDCRTPWECSDECNCGCCTVTVGDGVNSIGQYTSIQQAIDSLPAPGGEVCILPGRYFEYVLIAGRKDIVIRGCGSQTRIASTSLKPQAQGDPASPLPLKAPASASSGGSTFNAVITVSQSQHVQLLSFAVEAADAEVGILIDGTGKLSPPPPPPTPQGETSDTTVLRSRIIKAGPTLDVAIEDLIITASTLPAILADNLTLLQIESNRIAMQNVASRWPAVWISGREIRIVHNWVGIQSKTTDLEWLPATVQGDIGRQSVSGTTTMMSTSVPMTPGGIQIAATSTGATTSDVFVIENEIDGAGRNGITLGSLAILDANGGNTGEITGTTVEIPGPCDTTITLQIPGSKSGQTGTRIVAAGKLSNIQINHNRIRNTGACGIGPVGFFDPKAGPEIVMVENLTIGANAINRTLLREVTAATQVESGAFGAIGLPYVENLVIRDNAITDFGVRPGASVCGIFVLVGQMMDISRNQVLEARDWNLTASYDVAPGLLRGGIVIAAATPPSFVNPASLYTQSDLAEYTTPSFVPGVPALRVEHNVVRVASGEALEVFGFGPFSIVNNHLSTAGTPRGGLTTLAQTVLILNLGVAIEAASLFAKYSMVGKVQTSDSSVSLSRAPATTSNGTVIFTNNICQLEARATKPHFFSSVTILSLDDLIFSNNQCWVDAVSLSGLLDAFLLASYVQVTGNRFQEAALFPVLASGYTAAALNITAQNISTYCLFCTGTLQPALDANNLSLISNAVCNRAAEKLNLNVKKS